MKANLKLDIYTCIVPFEVEIPSSVSELIKNKNLFLKKEFHITLVGYDIGNKIKKLSDENKKVVQSLLEPIDRTIELTDTYSLLEEENQQIIKDGITIPKHIRRTLVRHIIVPQLQLFYEELSQVLGEKLATPFAHVTLASWSDYKPYMQRGIGIYSQAEFEQLKVQSYELT